MSLEQDIASIVGSFGARIYDIEIASENGKAIYRILLSKKEGVTLELCSEISHMVSPLLDVTPPIKGDYSLEVSSAGIERKLKKIEHFQNSLGESVKLVLLDNSVVEGELLSVEGRDIVLKSAHGEEHFDFDEILKARTYYQW